MASGEALDTILMLFKIQEGLCSHCFVRGPYDRHVLYWILHSISHVSGCDVFCRVPAVLQPFMPNNMDFVPFRKAFDAKGKLVPK